MATAAFLGWVMLVCVLALVCCACAAGAVPDLPETDRPLLNTVDPWGLAFSDQLVRYRAHFAQEPDASFALGITHDLVKILPVKYWFRGETVAAGAPVARMAQRWAAAGETQAFQVVVLPRIGAPTSEYQVTVEAPGCEVEVWRQVFVRTCQAAAYPRFASEWWPDPLVPEATVVVEGSDCGAFWVDVALPADFPAGQVECRVTVTCGPAVAQAVVPIRVVSGLRLDPKDFPFIGWFWRRTMNEEQFRELCALVLRHHVLPVDALKGQWDPANPGKFDALREFLASHGQRMFEVDRPGSEGFDSLYAHLRDRGWLDSTWVYSNQDEPDHETFVRDNIPFLQMVREKYPGLKVYLASDWHPNMEQGCDAWMTDLSASGYDPERHRDLKAPELWHYYCHLPVRWQMRAPLVQAPNMQIDNPALEHRLALWMSDYYGAKAVFIWAGNAYTFGDDFWQTLKLSEEPSAYPYAGIHNGNGWVVYPSPDGQTTLPSLRLKIIRDGLEDVALLRALRRALDAGEIPAPAAEELRPMLNPTPGVFVHPHYFDQLPDTLLGHRTRILRALAGAGE